MKKLLSGILASVMVFSMTSPVFAEVVYDDIVGEERVSVGADLSSDQKATVYGYFGISQGSVEEVTVTIDDEKAYLSSYIDESMMGTRSLSSIYMTLLEEDSSITIDMTNINWLTKENYENAMITLGITNAKVIIASPVSVSGTAALTGIYKAYEDITGEEIDEETKEAATEELVTTGELADEIGNDEASALVNEIKLASDELAEMDDEEAKEEINNIAINLNITLTDGQLDKLLSLARSLENVDLSGVESALKGISDKFSDILDIDTGGFWDSIVNFFKGIIDWIVGLFTGGDDEESSSEVDSALSTDSSVVSDESVSEDSSLDEDDSSSETSEESEVESQATESSEVTSSIDETASNE